MKIFVAFFVLFVATSTKAAIENRIVGGIIPSPGSFPYMATLHITMEDSEGNQGGGFCGGSLISDQYVLTAGHCLIDAVKAKVYLGAHNIDRPEENRIEMMVHKEGLILYEGYNRNSFMNDVALIKLPQKVNFTHRIQPVRLARRSQTNLDGRVAVISGWGNINNSEGSEILRYAQVRIFPDEKCKKFFSIYYHPTNICLDGTRQSACVGDSGGPAVIVEKEDRQLTQVGIASYVSPRGCEEGHPFAYAKVASFLDWIHEQTGVEIRE